MIREIVHIEKLRSTIRKPIFPQIGNHYLIEGPGRIVGWLIFLSFFTLLPSLLKIIWPSLLLNLTCTPLHYIETTMYVGSIFVMNIGIFLLYNTTMYVIYTIKHPFF